jgi:uncharacterized membrane protein
MGVPQALSENRRIRAIDAARGSAMLFVFFSHFVEVFFRRHGLPVNLAYLITQIASPAFISISGVMLGILFSTRREKYAATRSSFIRRGIFLLTAGRLLIYLAHIPMAGGWREALHWGFMTDAIGVCIIAGPLLIDKVSKWGRVAFGLTIYFVSWVPALVWVPSELPLVLIRETLFGSYASDLRFYTDVFPLLPWLGLYLVATALGEYWGDELTQGRSESIGPMARRVGFTALACAGALVGARILADRLFPGSVDMTLRGLLSPQQKLPPGPVYFLFYGGWTFLLLFALMRCRRFRAVERLSAAAEVLGRNSLFAFIAQYIVYFGLFPLLVFPGASIWPLLFVTSVMVIWVLAYLWDKAKLNRYLTMPSFGIG